MSRGQGYSKEVDVPEIDQRLEELVAQIIEALGVPVEFGALLLFLERRNVPYSQAKRAIWRLIQMDTVAFNQDGALVKAA